MSKTHQDISKFLSFVLRHQPEAIGLSLDQHGWASIDTAYPEQRPPEWLFHGTATRFLAAIKAQGPVPGARHYVHLCADEQQ